MGFFRQEYWSGLPFPSPGNIPDPGIKLASSMSAGGFFTTDPPRKPREDSQKTKEKAKIAILISDRSNFKARKLIRDKEEWYLMIMGSVLQEDITNL